MSNIIKRNTIPGLSFTDALSLKHGADRNGAVKFKGKKMAFTNNKAFVYNVKEIFVNEVYKVDMANSEPFIIDCGSNIGLSILYFKEQFPNARIIGFEPDPKIFLVLTENIKTFDLANVELRNTGLWDDESELVFHQEGTMSGSFEEGFAHGTNTISIKTEKLSQYLDNKVDILKIDIEGAEYRVLSEIRPLLFNVDKILMEYHSIVGKEQDLSGILSILKEAGFRYYIKQAMDTTNHSFIGIDKITDGCDFSLMIFGVRS